MKYLLAIFVLTAILGSCKKPVVIKVHAEQSILDDIQYGLDKIDDQLTDDDGGVSVASTKEEANVVLNIVPQQNMDDEKNDGFTLAKSNGIIELSSECNRGLLYGLLDIAEQLSNGKSLDNLKEKSITAHHDFRAIKFNLPWYSYRSGKNLSQHLETCKDPKFWESFLDMMVADKFNALTLWNMHPYMYMVKSTTYPKASPFTDKEMAEWEVFWKHLFKMAKDRGIDTYVVNWNIFLPENFAKEYGGADYSSETGGGFIGDGETNKNVENYTREMVTLTLNKYKNLTGIGLSLGERMGGMTSEERKDWADRTLIAGLKAANRKARLIYRAPLSAGLSNAGSASVSAEKITREAIETMGLDDDVWIEFKFNWSHGHSSPKLSIVHGGMLTDTYWNPYSEKYKAVWTMRNEDFFVMRWGDPDFIRTFLDLNSQKYVGGCIIGSETYIPAKDYITKKEFRTWDYAYQRQWLFYKVWGNLLYNRSTPDSYFEKALADKFNLNDGKELMQAWKLASKNPNRLASFFGSTWDGTLYSEGFTTNGGRFIDIDKFISRNVLDSSYVNIKDFVAGNFEPETQITPLQLANTTVEESEQILDVLKEIRSSDVSQELEIELTDLEFWANYGFYFATKIKAGVALEKFRKGIDPKGQQSAVEILTAAKDYWVRMVELAERYNVPVMPSQFDPKFSWRKHIVDAEHDITIAKEN